MNLRAIAPALLAITLATGCAATRSPVPFPDFRADVPPAVAEYRSETRHIGESGHAPVRSRWRLWREADRQVREYPENHTAEHWSRDGKTVFHTKYFHAEQRGIEFQQDDLEMVGALPGWQQIALLVSPDVLSALPVRASGTRQGYPWIRLAGTHNSVKWDVTLRTDLMLPMTVRRESDTEVEQLTLVSAAPLAQADWRPEAVETYGVLDFADLGDNERDPFVLRVQNHLGIAHEPVHAH